MAQLLMPGSVVAMTDQAADRLLKLDSGDAALLYLHLLRWGTPDGLRWPEDRKQRALDQLKENEIYIAAGGTKRCAYWGELLTAAARTRKASGAVVNGWHRDTPQVLSQNWPVFSCGCYAQDSSVRTQVVDFRCDIEIGQVRIHDGDLIFGDVDGVLVIPREAADEVLIKALKKAAGEKTVRKAIEDGMSATDAFAKFGIL